MACGAKLKVYCMPAGCYDAVVAVPSQKAALRAWGTTTDAERELAAAQEALATERRELDQRERDMRSTRGARIGELTAVKERADRAYRAAVEKAARTRSR